MLQGWLAPVICAELPQSEDRKSSIDSIMTTTRTCVFHVLLIFTVLFLTGCGGVGTSSGGSTVVSYTISDDGSSVTCPGADGRADSAAAVVCSWTCGTWKGRTGIVFLTFTKSPSFHLSSDQVTGRDC
jgi:hypothetical protein